MRPLQKVAYFNSISANVGSTSTPMFGAAMPAARKASQCWRPATSSWAGLIYRGSYHYNAPLHQSLHISDTETAALGYWHVESGECPAICGGQL